MVKKMEGRRSFEVERADFQSQGTENVNRGTVPIR